MKKIIILLFIFNLFSVGKNLFAQHMNYATGYSSQYDDYYYDYMNYNGQQCYLFKRFAFNNLSDTTWASLIKIPNNSEIVLGTEFSNLKFTKDSFSNIYITGLYSPNILDTSYLFVTKLDLNGIQVWTNLYEKHSESVSIFIDDFNYLYIYDHHYLHKLNLNGNLIWKKEHLGSIKLSNNIFYKIQGLHILFNQGKEYCDTVLLQKIDTSGNQVFQKTINISNSPSTEISTNFNLHIIDNKIFISNSYWGDINVDPSGSNQSFVNTNTHWSGPFNIRDYNNYLAVYDTLGNLIIANSKNNFPKLNYGCIDSAGSIYFSGITKMNGDFNLNSMNVTNINTIYPGKSFIAKYTSNLDYIWGVNINGYVNHIDTGHYFQADQELEIAGDFNGSINLQIDNPNTITFTSSGNDLFYAKYYNLNDNGTIGISTNIENHNNWLIYPNPCKDLLNIEIKDFNNAQLELFDLSGKLKLSKFLNNDTKIHYLNLSNLKSGYYILRLKNKDIITTQKLIINK